MRKFLLGAVSAAVLAVVPASASDTGWTTVNFSVLGGLQWSKATPGNPALGLSVEQLWKNSSDFAVGYEALGAYRTEGKGGEGAMLLKIQYTRFALQPYAGVGLGYSSFKENERGAVSLPVQLGVRINWFGVEYFDLGRRGGRGVFAKVVFGRF